MNKYLIICALAFLAPIAVPAAQPPVNTPPAKMPLSVFPLTPGSDDLVVVGIDGMGVYSNDSSITVKVEGHPNLTMIRFIQGYLESKHQP
jgi:hypothetical protein